MTTEDPSPTGSSRGFDRRSIPTALLLLCLVLAAVGETFLSSRFAWVGFAAFVTSFATLLLLLRSLEGGPQGRLESLLFRLIGERVSDLVGAVLIALGIAGALAATWYSQTRTPFHGGWPAFAFWLAGILALAAFAIRRAVRARRISLPLSRVEVAGVAAVTAVAFLLRFIRLSEVPYPMSGDEASVGLEGMRILDGSSTDMFRTGWSLQPYLSFLGPALSMSQFGTTVVGLRLFPVLTGTLAVPVLYLLVRSMFSRPVASIAAVLLGAMAFHIHFSRIAVNNSDAAFLVCVVAGLLYALASTRRSHWYVAAGLATGFGLYSFAGARLVFVLAFLYFTYLFATDRKFRSDWPKLLLFVVAVGVVVLPTAVHFLEHRDVGFGRLGQMGVFQTGWIDHETARTGDPAIVVLGRQLLRSFAILVSAPAISGFYNSPKPLLDPFWSIALVLGIMFSWTRPLDRRHVLLNLWLWSVLLFGGALVLPPPAAERLLIAAPAVVALIALGVWNIWSLVGKISGRKAAASAGALLTAVLLAAGSVHFYFREYTPGYYFTDVNGEVGTELGLYLARRPRVRYVYFTGLPRMWYRSLPSTDFLSGAVPGEDFAAGTVPDIRGKRRPLLFVVLPHLRTSLIAVQQAYPGGRILTLRRRPSPGEPLFFLYRLD